MTSKSTPILFMGTPEFAAVSLDYLVTNGYNVVGVVCRADKAAGRGMTLQPPPVKVTALAHNLPVYQPEHLKNGELDAVLEELKPELILVVAYGRLLPDKVLEYPKYGCINLHGSVLPAYRGAAPIQRAVMDGCKTTGLTTMYLSQGMDEGDMIDVMVTEIGPDETAGELTARLARVGAPFLAKTVDALVAGTAVRTPQDHTKATYAKMLDKAEGILDFNMGAEKLYGIYRGLTPALSVSTVHRGKKLRLTQLTYDPETYDGVPGEIVVCKKGDVRVRCGDGHGLRILRVAPEGKKETAAADWVNGRGITLGEILG